MVDKATLRKVDGYWVFTGQFGDPILFYHWRFAWHFIWTGKYADKILMRPFK